MQCELCGCELIEKKRGYGKAGFGNFISRHHCFPKRFLKFFNKSEIKHFFKIDNENEQAILCYYCHEELIHNIIINKKIIKKLNKKMLGKTIKERIVLLYKQLLGSK